MEIEKWFLMLLKVECFHYNKLKGMLAVASESTSLKILTTGQILQRLPIAFAQVKASNTLENLLTY